MTQKIKIQKRIFLFFAVITVSVTNMFAQDVITLKNGNEITALVYEIGDIDVKYKKIDNPNGPNYTLKKLDISMIKYANGSQDIFSSSATAQPSIQNTDDKTFKEIIEETPQYPGGTKSLEKYLAKNLHYPKYAEKRGIQGQVIIRFLIKENGSISDISLVKKLQKNCDSEAIRLVQMMPRWIPCSQNGIPVKAYYSLIIDFKL